MLTRSHIRQLIYIALQPVKQVTDGNVPLSPSKKMALKNRVPSGDAVEGARRLLISFARTNLPETLAGALPCCDDPSNVENMENDSLESVIGVEALSIKMAKSCWNILAEGFKQQKEYVSPVRRRNPKRISSREDPEEDIMIEDAAVGENAWSVLEWLLVLFEQDELSAVGRGSGESSRLW